VEGLRAEDLVSTGGTWSGLLFENRRIGLRPQLSWGFFFDIPDVTTEVGTTSVSLAVDRVALNGARWSAIDGWNVSSSRFSEPIEPSVYFFEHHCYDAVQMRVESQRGRDVVVSVQLRGDVDGLGLDQIEVHGELTFTGISVVLEKPPRSVATAKRKLRHFTDVEGLVGKESVRAVRFTPAT
jgi:hypothetical protein